MKKFATAVFLAMVMAGCAFAAQPSEPPKNGMGDGPGMERREMSSAERAKMEEMAKLNSELRAELQKASPDKAKARQIYKKITALKNESENARLEEMLANPKMSKNRPNGPERNVQKPNGQEHRQNMPEMSAADKAKMEEMDKLNKNIQAELQKDNPNKANIRTWHKKAQSIKNAMDDARFEEMLKNPSKYQNDPMFGNDKGGPGHKNHKPEQ